jgi:putative ABC transport system permease protein
MGTIFKIALRNLVQHKVKTLIVGALITLGILLTFVGNSLFESAAKGVKRGYSENFTGDVMIMGQSEKAFSLFGSQDFSAGPGGEPIPVIQHYPELVEFIKSYPGVMGFSAQVSGFGILNFDEAGMGFNLLFGVDPETYFKTFHSIKIVEGRMLANGEPGIMMSRKRIEDIKKQNKVSLKVGQEISLEGFSKSGLKIRTVPLVGVYEYIVPTQALEIVSFIDVQTLRALNAMTVGTAKETPIDDATKKVLDSADDFFSDGPVAAAGAAKDKVDLNAILGDKTKRAELATVDSGSWHNLMIRLNDGVSPSQTISELNKVFSEKNWPLKAVGWKEAAGTSAALTDVAQIIFNIVVIILAIVAVIIIINTLVISVMERTAEIGTMRALGAQKPFVRQLFVWETMLLAGFFGLVGIVIGSLSVVALNLIGLPLDNEFLQVLFGSKNLKPELSLVQVVLSIGFTLFIGVVSWIYPVSIALKVSPLKAIASE